MSIKRANISAWNLPAKAKSPPILLSRFPIQACLRLGYAEQSNIPFDFGIIRNHYVGRTFIQPTDAGRQNGVKMKHNVNRHMIEGKRVVLVDDSIVRGTTSMKIANMMRQAGAKEVHLRIASPPTTHPCFYGVDTPDREKLIAAHMNPAEIAEPYWRG